MRRVSDRIRRLETAVHASSGVRYLISDEPMPDSPEEAEAALQLLGLRCGRFGFAAPYELCPYRNGKRGIVMSATKRRLERLEHSQSDSGRTVITAECPLPDDPSERQTYLAAAFAEERARRRRIPRAFHVHVKAHAHRLTSEEWVTLYAPKTAA